MRKQRFFSFNEKELLKYIYNSVKHGETVSFRGIITVSGQMRGDTMFRRTNRVAAIVTAIFLLLSIPSGVFAGGSVSFEREPKTEYREGDRIDPKDIILLFHEGNRAVPIRSDRFEEYGVKISPDRPLKTSDNRLKVDVFGRGTLERKITVTPYYPYQPTASENQVQAPTVDMIKPGDREITGTAEVNAMILLYDQDGYQLGKTWAYKGKYKVKIGREAKDGEVFQLYASKLPKLKSEPTKRRVGDPGILPGRTVLPQVEKVLPGDKSLKGYTAPYAVLELRDRDGKMIVRSFTADGRGNFNTEIPPAKGGDVYYLTAEDPELDPSTPLKIKVEEEKKPVITVNTPRAGDTKVTGSTIPSGYVEIRNDRGMLLGNAFSDSDGLFTVDLLNGLESGEKLELSVGKNIGDRDGFVNTVVEYSTALNPVPETVYEKTTTVTGKALPESTVVLYNYDGHELSRTVAGKDGRFTLKSGYYFLAGETLYLTAETKDIGRSEKVEVTVQEGQPTKIPEIDKIYHGAWNVTGATEPYGQIEVRNAEGKQLGINWAGETGRFTVSLKRPAAGGETLIFIATGKGKIPSEEVKVTVEQEGPKKEYIAYMNGYPDGTFRPENGVTRGEAAAMLARLIDPARAYYEKSSFKDVRGKWYEHEVAYLEKEGMMKGYPDGTFKPEEKMTRGEFASMMAPLYTEFEKKPMFKDVKGHWSENAVKVLYGNDAIDGYPDGTFKPDKTVTRAEATALFNRIYKRTTDEDAIKDIPITKLRTFTDVGPSHWAYYHILDATNNHTVVTGPGDPYWVE